MYQEIATISDRKFKKLLKVIRPMEEKLQRITINYLNYETIPRDQFIVLVESTILINKDTF